MNAFNTSSTSFNAIGPVEASSGSQQAVADAFAPILLEVAITLEAVEANVPGLPIVLAGLGLDFAINKVLLGLDIVLSGVLHLLAGLLFDASAILRRLGLVLVLLTLVL